MVTRSDFQRLVDRHGSDRYYKEFKTWDHFISLMFGILTRCDSISEILNDMSGMSGKLEYLNLYKVPANSTFSDGMRETGRIVFLKQCILNWSSHTPHLYRSTTS
jgi:hypothetical protein